MNGNFKVRCIDLRGQNLDTYKIGKAYEVVNGKLISERDCPIGGYFTSIEDVNRFSASKFELITGNQSIVIYRKGRDTIATLKEGKTVICTVKATCNPTDTWSDEIGARLALARIYDPSVKHIEIETIKMVKKVKRPAKVGEWIEIVSPIYNLLVSEKDYRKGDTLRVSKRESCETLTVEGHKGKPINDREYVVLENYTSEVIAKPIADYTDKELVDELLRRLEVK